MSIVAKFFNKKVLAPFDWLLIISIISLNIAYAILAKEIDLVGSVAGISGVICVVLVAKGNILNYFFGLINVSLYAYISYKSALYGDALLNAVYYLPMQFIGWFNWMRRTKVEDRSKIEAKRMNLKQRLMISVLSISLVLIFAYVLLKLNDPQPLKDSATTILSIIAMFLMVRAYMEQWVLWVLVNIISVIMWIICYVNDMPHAMLMVIMWAVYLLNSINGWVQWLKLSKKEDNHTKNPI